MEENLNNEPRIVQTDVGAKDGQEKCPKCGATEIALNPTTGKLKCMFCRHEFEPLKVVGMVEDLSSLEGQVMGSGATDIVADTNDVLTFKCSSCGAEVVIDTSSASQARCHWCRNTLSVNQQIPNGSIPDKVLPFTLKKEEAKIEIEKFVSKRKFFAHPQFKKEFTTENIMGVYFPYMLVDVNAHASLAGEGEHQTRKYYVTRGDHKEARYDADLYHVERDFDITIENLSVESNSTRLDTKSKTQTNNVINAIMPFDTENCVKYNANYLRGYTSEKRDTNVDDLRDIVDVQTKDVVRFAANDTIEFYDRGVAWSKEDLNVKGQQWETAYLPVWLYSYQQVKGDRKLLHYVAVNARTKETMGSVPIHMPKLLFISFLFEIIGVLIVLYTDFDYRYAALLLGFVYFGIMYGKYRNSNARHTYELETKKNITNLSKVDNKIREETGLVSPRMKGANNTTVNGAHPNKVLQTLTGENLTNSVMRSITKDKQLTNFVKDSIEEQKGSKE